MADSNGVLTHHLVRNQFLHNKHKHKGAGCWDTLSRFSGPTTTMQQLRVSFQGALICFAKSSLSCAPLCWSAPKTVMQKHHRQRCGASSGQAHFNMASKTLVAVPPICAVGKLDTSMPCWHARAVSGASARLRELRPFPSQREPCRIGAPSHMDSFSVLERSSRRGLMVCQTRQMHVSHRRLPGHPVHGRSLLLAQRVRKLDTSTPCSASGNKFKGRQD